MVWISRPSDDCIKLVCRDKNLLDLIELRLRDVYGC